LFCNFVFIFTASEEGSTSMNCCLQNDGILEKNQEIQYLQTRIPSAPSDARLADAVQRPEME